MTGIYLDYNATTPVDPRVAKAMLPWLQEKFGNPSSSHIWGAQAKQAIELARREVAGLIGCRAKEIIFTSGGTEANNIAIRGAALARRSSGGHVVASAVEHPAVLQVLHGLAHERDYTFSLAPVDANGRVDPKDVIALFRKETVLVTIMHSNNEVGTLQPIRKIAAAAASQGILVHSDAAQSASKVPLHVPHLGVDLLSLAGHKIYGPKGIGALYCRADTPLSPILRGASQEGGRRPGTEPVMLAAGMGRASKVAAQELAAGEEEKTKDLRDHLEKLLATRLPQLHIHAKGASRLPGTLSAAIPGLLGPDLVFELGDRLAFSAGAACHDDRQELSHVLQAMAVPTKLGLGTIRLSVGRFTTKAELDQAAELFTKTVKKMLQRGGAP